jgi:putative membrane protein
MCPYVRARRVQKPAHFNAGRVSDMTSRSARIRSYALCTAAASLLLLAACENRAQKPKVAALWPIGAAHAQQTDNVVPPAAITGRMAPLDEAFAHVAASNDLAQIEAARLALKAARSEDVRDFAQRVMRAHTQAGEQLRRIVAPRGLKLPAAPTGRHADMVTKLSGLAARDLEDAFLQRFGLDAHKEAISLFERHVAEGKNPELKRHAQDMLPVLREHMAAAHKLIHAAAAAR